ncbi:anoctamin-9 isoform X2 [Elephas maximus indicus]|uniref:anoctamin-9 isoform X2 n=1 Tax=Elephas maximus indicus TaxID=99487 RepID=UPI00211689C8|nr:anoctamin-9 isoform X2 [Elephas maximus indicus]
MQGEDRLAASEEDSIPLIAIHPCEGSLTCTRAGPSMLHLPCPPWAQEPAIPHTPCPLLNHPGPAAGPQHPSSPQTKATEPWDYVFVASRDQSSEQCSRQQQFLEELKRKGFRYKEMEDQHKKYFGILAENEIFLPYCKLLMEPEGPVPRSLPAEKDPTLDTTRIRIIHTFIQNNKTADGETFDDLKKDQVFETGFFLHTVRVGCWDGPGAGPGERKHSLLAEKEEKLKKWAQWRNVFCEQPIDAIRNYFGEKVALYFAWLGWYTYMLVPAAVAGLILFLTGLALFDASQISKEICEAHDIFMCPRGDHHQGNHRLSDTCTFAKLTHLFDNEGTVLFAIFMALWATVFLEVWKRQRARVVQDWHLYGWDEDEEEMMLELINCPQYQPKRYEHSYLRSTVILVLSLLMICLMIGMAHVLVIYRVLVAALFSHWASPSLKEQVTTAVVVSGALVHYVTIVIMTKVNRYVALKLCDYEKPRTFSERESKFTVKFFTLQFFAHFSSLIYIAFILGRINGHPGKSVRLAGLWKLEECHLSGCMMDLFVQMAIIMGLKQTLSNCVEYLGPWLRNKCRRCQHGRVSQDPELRDWQHNYLLGTVNVFSLFDEFMEMMMQYGFTTIFVAAFPLAPLLALFSNLVEIRLDAIKMTWLQQRLVPRKAKDIGTWLQVLETIGVLAVIGNGLVIAFTSEFIPRVVYKYRYGPCRQGAHPAVEYRDYRNAQDYNLSEQFWFLLAIRLAFLILFEHVALCIKLIAAWFVPDVPRKVNNDVLSNKFGRVQKKMKYERQKLQRPGGRPASPDSHSPPTASSSKSTAV